MLKDKKIILSISGSIAAYKSALLCRLLIKAGAEVQVIMSEASKGFITPLTMATLSKRPALSEYVKDEGRWNNHVDLGLWADAMLIAPASANTLAKCAGGHCENLLQAVYLSARCPVFFAPAMDLDMFVHPSVQSNIIKLKSYNNRIIEPGSGELASGLEGKGRMAEPEQIIEALEHHFFYDETFAGKRVLMTAGPTKEPIDPVRFITNHSTGKMGYAIANRLAKAGADVRLVSGDISQPLDSKVQRLKVFSAEDMYQAAMRESEKADIIILSAAVADYKPAEISDIKLKKKDDDMSIRMIRTRDIAATLGKQKREGQLIIGFALETNNEKENARGKLQRKNFDMIVLNSLRDKGAGFGHDTNKITIITEEDEREYPLKSKKEVAGDIVARLREMLGNS